MSSGIAELRGRLTRRRLLGLGVGVGALTLLGGAGWLVSVPSPASGRVVLSEAEAELLTRLGEVWFPGGNPLGVAAADVDLAQGLDEVLSSFTAREQRVLHVLLRALDQFPRATLRSSTRFRELPLEERRALLVEWEGSLGPKRQLAGLLRILVGIPFFEDERVRLAIGHQFGCPLPLPVTG